MSYIVDDQLSHKKYRKDIRNYKILVQIATGGFGEIFKLIDIKTNEMLASKTIFSSKTTNYQIYREIKIMIHLRSPTIIKFYGYSLTDFDNQDNITLFMEYAENKSLYDLLKNERLCLAPIEYDNTARQIILIGIAYSMMLLNKYMIIHRDLSPSNILLDENLYPKLTDFGLSKKFEKEYEFDQSMICGNTIYMSPEELANKPYGMKSDVYSFGLIAYEIVTSKTPYNKLTKIREPHFVPEFDNIVCESIQKLISCCLAVDQKYRPSFKELYYSFTNKKYFLDNVDEEKIIDYIEYITDHEIIQDFEIFEQNPKKFRNKSDDDKSVINKINENNIKDDAKKNPTKISPRKQIKVNQSNDKLQMKCAIKDKEMDKKIDTIKPKEIVNNDKSFIEPNKHTQYHKKESTENIQSEKNYGTPNIKKKISNHTNQKNYIRNIEDISKKQSLLSNDKISKKNKRIDCLYEKTEIKNANKVNEYPKKENNTNLLETNTKNLSHFDSNSKCTTKQIDPKYTKHEEKSEIPIKENKYQQNLLHGQNPKAQIIEKYTTNKIDQKCIKSDEKSEIQIKDGKYQSKKNNIDDMNKNQENKLNSLSNIKTAQKSTKKSSSVQFFDKKKKPSFIPNNRKVENNHLIKHSFKKEANNDKNENNNIRPQISKKSNRNHKKENIDFQINENKNQIKKSFNNDIINDKEKNLNEYNNIKTTNKSKKNKSPSTHSIDTKAESYHSTKKFSTKKINNDENENNNINTPIANKSNINYQKENSDLQLSEYKYQSKKYYISDINKENNSHINFNIKTTEKATKKRSSSLRDANKTKISSLNQITKNSKNHIDNIRKSSTKYENSKNHIDNIRKSSTKYENIINNQPKTNSVPYKKITENSINERRSFTNEPHSRELNENNNFKSNYDNRYNIKYNDDNKYSSHLNNYSKKENNYYQKIENSISLNDNTENNYGFGMFGEHKSYPCLLI